MPIPIISEIIDCHGGKCMSPEDLEQAGGGHGKSQDAMRPQGDAAVRTNHWHGVPRPGCNSDCVAQTLHTNKGNASPSGCHTVSARR